MNKLSSTTFKPRLLLPQGQKSVSVPEMCHFRIVLIARRYFKVFLVLNIQ